MRYLGTVIRPPSEANSYILQVTYGCSHNCCSFYGTYLDKPFRPRETIKVLEDIKLAGSVIPHNRRVFLADGDALVLRTDRLGMILDALQDSFPNLERVGTYANARNLLHKSVDELKTLRHKGLGIVYLGLESGSDEVLTCIDKRATSSEMITAVTRAKNAGMLVSVIGILGIAGPDGLPRRGRCMKRRSNAFRITIRPTGTWESSVTSISTTPPVRWRISRSTARRNRMTNRCRSGLPICITG